MVHRFACLLLLLTCLAGFSVSEMEQSGTFGPVSVVISGVDIVAVGILYGFQCSASCNPGCQYNWTWGNVTSQGPDLSLHLLHIIPAQNLTCTVVNPATGTSVTVQKMLQVTAGPSNIRISGPPMLTISAASIFTCSADCFPNCTYSWTVVLDDEKFSTTQGDTISVTPPASTVNSETLICVAQNTVSKLFISTTLSLWVASSSNIVITGENAVVMGKQYTYICSAICVPSCDFIWTYMGKTFKGDEVQLPILHQRNETKFDSRLVITLSDYSKIEPLTCEARNTISNVTITATKNLTVTDPISVRPSSQALPVVGKAFSLQCVGSQISGSITWLMNKHLMLASGRVHFSSDNITMTFSPLTQADDGLYQCVVAESRSPIQSVGYKLQVNYGPDEVHIVKPNKGPVGKELFALPGSTTELQCLSDCFPVCSITWFYHGVLLSTNASILFTPVTPPYEASLTCMAFNSVVKTNKTAETTVVVPEGPKNVVISGPDSLEIGVTASFTCSAECTPSCNFTWTLYGTTMTGSVIDVTVNRYVSKESISCQAENTISRKMAMVNETLIVSEPKWCGC